MNDDFINQFDPPKPPRPEFTAALYQRITNGTGGSAPMKTATQTPVLRPRAFRARALRAISLSFAIVAVIATILFFSPSARAFADTIIQQVTMKKGGVTIQPAEDAATASQLAGFTVLAPAYLPDGYTADTQAGAWMVSHETDGVMATISYNNQGADGHLSIIERMYQPGASKEVLNRPEIQDVTVRGQPGEWTPAGGKSMLTWDENGISYSIVTSLPKDEAIKVAESLGK